MRRIDFIFVLGFDREFDLILKIFFFFLVLDRGYMGSREFMRVVFRGCFIFIWEWYF